jgi:hypothetical protein
MLNYYVPVVLVVLAHFSNDAALMTLLNDQIGTRHKYQMKDSPDVGKWSIDYPGLTVRADGGISSIHVAEQRSNIECLVWTSTNYLDAYAVHGEIVRIVRNTDRTVVDGNLLLSLTFDTQPTQTIDPETGLLQLMFFLSGLVGENQNIIEGD